MAAAIENFHVMDVDNKMAILGDMRELGDASAEEHQKVVGQLKAVGLTNVWLVGRRIRQNLPDYRKFHDVEEVKGSHQTTASRDHYIPHKKEVMASSLQITRPFISREKKIISLRWFRKVAIFAPV